MIAKLGDFGGIDRDGAPIGFLWSNSLVFRGDDVLVTNLSLDVGTAIPQLGEELGLAHLAARNLRTTDGPWAHQVKVHTISKIKKRIPEGLDLARAARQQDPAGDAHDADRGTRAADEPRHAVLH
jgi:hypothetical protein